MKLVLFLTLLTAITTAFAEVIPCPTPESTLFNGKTWQWGLSRSSVTNSDGVTLFGRIDREDAGFRMYNPLKQEVGDGYKVKSIKIDNWMAEKASKQAKSVVLLCTGTYNSTEIMPSIIPFLSPSEEPKNGAVRAEITLEGYKECLVTDDRTGFSCTLE